MCHLVCTFEPHFYLLAPYFLYLLQVYCTIWKREEEVVGGLWVFFFFGVGGVGV